MTVKKNVKSLFGFLAYKSGVHARLLGNRAVIVAFHRVSDSAGKTSLNCPPAIFDDLCRFFKTHFTVAPLSELLERLHRKQSIGNMLVITFDDGYKDNLEVAAQILLTHGLPATFFVTTNFIGSRTIPFWDVKDGVESEWMTWDDVDKLKELGFDIGGHTINHVNLAEVQIEEAAREISGCRQILTDKLNVSIPHFAYPFGGTRNITREAIDLVAEAGFACCMSCEGGIVSASDSAFELQREPINSWVSSPYQYGFELLMKAMEARK